MHYILHLYPSTQLHLITYTDADCGECPGTRRSSQSLKYGRRGWMRKGRRLQFLEYHLLH